MPATRGPIPKRTELRRRTNAPKTGEETTKVAAGADPEPMEPDEDWHPVAINWYLGLADSGQHVFYEQSDWDTAYIVAENISRLLKPVFVGMEQRYNASTDNLEVKARFVSQPMKGADLSALLKAMGDLLVTEGARRRMRLELQRDIDPAEHVQTPGEAQVYDIRNRLTQQG
jgi:hypothetical protein